MCFTVAQDTHTQRILCIQANCIIIWAMAIVVARPHFAGAPCADAVIVHSILTGRAPGGSYEYVIEEPSVCAVCWQLLNGVLKKWLLKVQRSVNGVAFVIYYWIGCLQLWRCRPNSYSSLRAWDQMNRFIKASFQLYFFVAPIVSYMKIKPFLTESLVRLHTENTFYLLNKYQAFSRTGDTSFQLSYVYHPTCSRRAHSPQR